MQILFIFLFLLMSPSFATTHLSTEAIESFGSILDAQGVALEKMDIRPHNKSLPFGFKLNEMVTNISVSKSGVMGISALKSNTGVEIKWKKISPKQLLHEIEERDADFLIEAGPSEEEIESLTDSIVRVVEVSGKVKNAFRLRSNVINALNSVHEQIQGMEVTSFKQWKASALRLDLNFSANGAVWFFAKAGVALRLRLEWELKDRPLMKSEAAMVNPQTRFVVKAMAELNQAMDAVPVAGFEAQKIMIGVGASRKRKFFGLWKYSAGFIGWLAFEPTKVNYKINEVIVPAELLNEDFYMGELEPSADLQQKGIWPWRRRKIPRASFQSGMKKSLQTAAFFAGKAMKKKNGRWQVEQIKTVNDISQTGLFGLSSVSTRGIVEIDFNRK